MVALIDPVPSGPDMAFQFEQINSVDEKLSRGINEEILTTQAKLYLPTLARFQGRGSGTFALSVLKKMEGTERFLAQKDISKGCSLQSFDECQTEGFLQEMEAVCGCQPWALSLALDHQVPTR